MQELGPLICGLVLGIGLGVFRAGIRLPVGAVLSVAIGVLATITGEFKGGWLCARRHSAGCPRGVPWIGGGAAAAADEIVMRQRGGAPR
jgi:hypothetical protein